ncbi:MAG: hypothetical protein SFX73_40100, partial [Kofleriaceae bacterium]|nr:hypothetical protein [Kofleriaceae bacterium]
MVVRVPHVLFVSTVAACAGPRTELVFDRTIPLPSARFAGPITVDVPRRDAFGGRDLEYVVELEARCTPALQIGYPDGEVRTVGASDGLWQSLLGARAAAGTKAEEPSPPAGTTPAPSPVDPAPVASTAPGSLTPARPGTPAPVYVGRWQQVTNETWPGQLRFLAERDRRCTASDRWSRRYLTGVDETGQLTVWADTPQELAGARLTVRVYAVGDVVVPRPVTASATVTAKAEVRTEVRVRPPKPAPKAERPGTSRDPGGVWRPGHWTWSDGEGRWVWISGEWGPPSTTPGPKTEDTGPLPAPGA